MRRVRNLVGRVDFARRRRRGSRSRGMTAGPQPARVGAVRTPAENVSIAGAAFKGLMVILVLAGIVGFIAGYASGGADRVWQAYLVNFLFWLGIAQSAVVLSAAFY